MEPTASSARQSAPAVAEHHEHLPGPRLSRWVAGAVGYRLTGFPAGVHVGMPSGSVTLVVPFDAPLTVADGGCPPTAYGAVLAGLSAAPTHIHHDGGQHGVQLALRPAATRALLGMPVAELAGRSHELSDVVGPCAELLRERLDGAGSWAQRFALVEEWLAGLLDAAPRAATAPAEVSQAWHLICASRGALPIREVAAQVGWSMRRLQREFRHELGLSPKTAAVIARFEASVPLVSGRRMSLSEVAVRCGWSDHAHMDHDWRALAGVAPSVWRSEDVLAAH